VLQLGEVSFAIISVEEPISSADDRIEDVIAREEIDEITVGYRRVAGFEVEELNRPDPQ
jgi:hypothetical protein